MTLTRYSDRLGAISEAQFQAALDHFSLGRFVSAQPTSRGLFGQNLFLTSTAGEFVLRGSPHNPEQLPSERFFARQVHERTTVVSPWPYLVCESPEIFGWSFGLMRRLHGIQLDDDQRKAFSNEERAAIAAVMGDTLASFGSATFPECGRYAPSLDQIMPTPGGILGERRAWITGMLESAMRFCPSTMVSDQAWLDGIVARGIEAESQSFVPTITTSDFGEGNALVERAAAGWRCSGVFDFMEYSIGDLEHAMVRPALNYACDQLVIGRAFLEAYGRRRGFRGELATRMAFYCLGDRLCIWNYGHSLATWFPPELSFRAWAEPMIQVMRQVVAGLETAYPMRSE